MLQPLTDRLDVAREGETQNDADDRSHSADREAIDQKHPQDGAATGAHGPQDGDVVANAVEPDDAVALWVAAILLVNEVPDIRADGSAGKRTLVVRLGVPATRRLYAGIQLGAIAAFLACGLFGIIHWWMALVALLLLPQAFGAARSICDVSEDRARLTRAIETTLKLHLSGSFLLVIAALVAKFVAH